MREKRLRPMSERAKKLVIEHHKYAAVLASLFTYQHGVRHLYDDIQGAAMLGLCKAASSYRKKYHTKFRTFAHHKIAGAMLDFLREQRWGKRSKKLLTEQYVQVPISQIPQGLVSPSCPFKDVDGADYMEWMIGLFPAGQARRFAIMRWVDGMKMKDIGKALGVTEGRASQIGKRAILEARAAAHRRAKRKAGR